MPITDVIAFVSVRKHHAKRKRKSNEILCVSCCKTGTREIKHSNGCALRKAPMSALRANYNAYVEA